MGLFIDKLFTSHSGKTLDFKIECDALSNNDLTTLAKIISKKYKFGYVYGIPKGGDALAKELDKYCDKTSDIMLIVDDVLTTGESMRKARIDYSAIINLDKIHGVVIFARGNCPEWIEPIFKMWNE